MISALSLIDGDSPQLANYYENIKESFAEYMDAAKQNPKYYHNRFFKNEKSIGLIRNSLSSRFDFIEVMQET